MLPDEALSILHAARQAYIGVSAKDSPHVTPVLYAPTRDGIAFPTAASTLKGRKLSKGASVGVTVRWGNRAVVFHGQTQVLDPLKPATLLSAADKVAEVATASASFAARNGIDLAGFVRDALSGKIGFKGLDRRVFVLVDAEDVAVYDNLPAVDDVQTVDAVLAFGNEDAPRVVPGQWDASGQRAAVLAESLNGWTSGPAAVVVDDYGAPGPAAKVGLMLRGTGQVDTDDSDDSDDNAVAWVAIDAEKTAAWANAETATVTVKP